MPTKIQTFVDALVALHTGSPRGIESTAIKQYFDDHNIPVDGEELFAFFKDFKAKGWLKGSVYMALENRKQHGAFRVRTFDSMLLGWASEPDDAPE